MQALTDEMRNYSLQEFKHNDLLSKKKIIQRDMAKKRRP